MPAVPESGERRSALRPALLVPIGLLALLCAGWFGWRARAPGEAPASPPPPAAAASSAPRAPVTTATPPAAAAPPAPAAQVTATPPDTPVPSPSFDIVRVNDRGQAVMAGRAAPGAEVVILDGGQEIARITANSRGEWVFVSDTPLPAGGRQLTLSATSSDGTVLASSGSVVLIVPERGEDIAGRPAEAPAERRALALLVPGPDAAPRVLQTPAAENAAATAGDASVAASAPVSIPAAPAQGARPPRAGQLNLEIVDYDEGGEVRFAGTAPANTPIRVYVDNAPVGDTVADAEGRWTLVPRTPVAPGTHALRVDQIAPQGGRVAARVELPFQRADLPPEALRGGKVVVQPGQSLWRIARAFYGRGVRYTVIYQANRDAIRDPSLIYPGQIFDLPSATN